MKAKTGEAEICRYRGKRRLGKGQCKGIPRDEGSLLDWTVYFGRYKSLAKKPSR